MANREEITPIPLPNEVELTDVPPAQDEVYPTEDMPEGSPFKDQTSPLDPVDSNKIDVEPEAAPKATPMRTALTAMAITDTGSSDVDEIMRLSNENVELAEKLLNSGQERLVRLQTATAQTERDINTVRDNSLGMTPIVPPHLLQDVLQTTAQHRAEKLQEDANTSIEREAIRKIEDLIAVGDYLGAKVLVNRMDPNKNTSFGVTREHLVKQVIIAEALEKAEADEQEESWIHALITAAISIPESILLGQMFQSLGNVDEGKGGYDPAPFRALLPGTELYDQLIAVQGMTSEQLADYMPKLIKNFKNNSTTLGLTDPGRVAGFISMLREGYSKERANTDNAFNILDIATLFPLARIGGGVAKTTDVILGAGSRKMAAERVAGAIDAMEFHGTAVTAQRTAIVPEEVMSNALPTAINPRALPDLPKPKITKGSLKAGVAKMNPDYIPGIPKVKVSLSGDISDNMAAARILMNGDEETGYRGLRSLSSTAREFNEEELDQIYQANLNLVRARTGSGIADFNPRVIELPSGQVTRQLEITLNKPFASEDEAMHWLHSNGYGADVTNSVKNDVVTRTTPEGERLFHGTNKDFEKFTESTDGKLGKGIYLTPDPDLAGEYANLGKEGANIRPVRVKTDKIFGYAQMEKGWTKEDLLAAADKLGIRTPGFEKDIEEFAKRFGKDGSMTSHNGYHAFVHHFGKDQFINILKKKGYDGVAAKFFGGTAEVNVFNPALIKGEFADVIEDVSGQFFPRLTVDVREVGFYTAELHPLKQGFFSRLWKNPSNTSDPRLFEKATHAGQQEARLLKHTAKEFAQTISKLKPTERKYLEQVALKGQNMMRWFSDREFRVLWERATGSAPSDVVEGAYRQYKVVNDLEYILRNSTVYAEYVTRGFEDLTFEAMGARLENKLGIVDAEGKISSSERYFDASESRHYMKGELTQERMDELRGQGYTLIRVEDGQRLKDGTEISNFLVKKSDLEVNPVRRNILEYREGGHRLYADKYFVKQAVRFRQPDEATSEAILKRPNVFVTASTKADAAKWADAMEAARLAVKNQSYTAKQLDDEIFKGQRGLPTGEEFLKGIEDETFQLDDPFEPVFDRQLPSAYSKTSKGAKFDELEDEPGFGGFYRTQGRIYYSRKGDILKSIDGETAPTLDPFQAQANALHNVVRLSSFSDFKQSAIHHWHDTYAGYLNRRVGASPIEVFNEATISRNIQGTALEAQIEGQRSAIRRILDFQTPFDRNWRAKLREIHEWIVGDTDSKLLKEISKAPLWFMDKNPVSALRGWAFDMKLGFFNPGQFAIQISTAFSAMALNPRYGLKGLGSVIPILHYGAMKKLGTAENALDLMVKRGMHGLAGFEDAVEFKEYVRFMNDSGFFDFHDTHALINASNPDSTFAVMNRTDALRQAGRVFFHSAETFNRLVAWRIAYGEAVEKFGKRGFKDTEFNEFVRGRAENYSFNMSQTSRSAWQKGILSIPTQFWAYNVRMLEALVGPNFTPAQKARLALMQVGVAGAAGIPGLGLVADVYNQYANNGNAPRLDARPSDPRGEPGGAEKVQAVMQRGILDWLMNEAWGVDVQIGQKWGTGDFFHETMKNILGLSRYGPVSTADMVGGATYSIMGEVFGSAYNVAAFWASHESGGNNIDLSKFEVETLFRQISTINNLYYKAWFAHQYGIYQSMKGQTMIADLPPASAAFFAMGFPPGEFRDREAIMAWREHRQESIKESALFINRMWEEGLRQPDKMETNAHLVNEFVNMLPVSERQEVLKQAHINRDPSDYDRLLRLKQTQDIVDATAPEEEN
jgi:hypothetical protein